MADIRNLLNQLASQEAQLQDTEFLAPCVRGGAVRTAVAGIIYTFKPKPRKFEGWGIFRPIDEQTAEFVEEPSLPQLVEYFKLLKPLRLRLAYKLERKSWLAYPVNESDARQRFGIVKPMAVHLVTEGTQFEQIIARGDGKSWWFEDIDRRSDPMVADRLMQALKEVTSPDCLQFKGMTPEMRIIYQMAASQAKEFAGLQDEKRLQKALKQGGGELHKFDDRGEFWRVEWTTADGTRHNSAISKGDLTVVSSGICLSGRDRDFDLQSLVGVMEGRDD